MTAAPDVPFSLPQMPPGPAQGAASRGSLLEVERALQRVKQAVANGEAPECVHALMLDGADALDRAGWPSARVRESASTLVPMFGMRAEHDRRRQAWWRRRRWQAPDYRALADRYRPTPPPVVHPRIAAWARAPAWPAPSAAAVLTALHVGSITVAEAQANGWLL